MEIRRKISPTFGVAGSFAGYILVIAGLSTLNSYTGFILIIIGAFFAFSSSGTSIDVKQNRYRQHTLLFGLFRVGDWEDLSPYNSLAIVENDISFRIFSRGNRAISSKSRGYLIYMVGDEPRFRVPVCKCRNMEKASIEAEILSNELNKPIIELDN